MRKWYVIEDRKQIDQIIRGILSEGLQIQVSIDKNPDHFISKILGLTVPPSSGPASPPGAMGLFLDNLSPESGNRLLPLSREVGVRCRVGQRSIQFTSRCCDMPGSDTGMAGMCLEFPEALKIRDLRREKRRAPEIPEFISVEFILGETPEGPQVWRLHVLDCSRHGLALLVTEIDLDLLKRLKPGDVIKDMTFYAKWAMITVDATIRHITPIRRGEHEGQYVLGIESSEIIESCRPPE